MNLKNKIGESVAATASQLGDSAEELAQEAQAAIDDRAAAAADMISGGSGRFLHSLEAAVAASGAKLRQDGYTISASAVDGVSSVLGETASRVEGQSPAALGNQIVNVMRANPVATCALFAGAGFALAAFLRSREAPKEQTGEKTQPSEPGTDQ